MILRKGEALLTLGAAALLTVPAQAHAPVQAYSPKSGGSAARSLERVAVVYDGTIRGGTLTVRGPGGMKASLGDGHVARKGRVLRARLKRGLKAGAYTASYRTIHSDGDATSGSWSFRLK